MNKIFNLSILLTLAIHSFSADNPYFNLKFVNYSTSEGLSSSTCTNIFQDSNNLLWFGTIDGLNTFDGYSFEVFRPITGDAHSISNNRINSITEDSQKRLWIATNGGLNVYNKLNKKFYRLNIVWSNSTESSPNYINQAIFDHKLQTIWFSCKQGVGVIHVGKTNITELDTVKAKLFQFKTNTPNDFAHYPYILYNENQLRIILDDRLFYDYNYTTSAFALEKEFALSSSSVDFLPAKFIIDQKGNVLFANNLKELRYWNPAQDSLIKLSLSTNNIPVFNIYQDSKKRIWISTDGYGIYLLNENLQLIHHIVHTPVISSSLPNNQPSYVIESADGIFWIASYNKGFSKLDFSQASFGHIAPKSNSSSSLSGTIVQAVIEDTEGNIWVGTDGDGLNKYDEKNNSFEHLSKRSGEKLSPDKLSSDKILHLMQDQKGNLWVSTWDGGINKYNLKTKRITRFKHDKEDEFSIGQNTAWYATEDRSGNIWVGTQNAGINVLKVDEEKFIKYMLGKNNCSGLISNFIFSLFIDHQNRVLVGTDIGLCYTTLPKKSIDFDTKLQFIQIPLSDTDKYRVNYLFQDHEEYIWVGTDMGLHLLNKDLQLVKSYSIEDGLPSNIVLGMVQDDDDNLWLTTKNGLSRLDIPTQTFHNFNTFDGVQDVEFQSKSIFKTKDGRIIAGGINGFNLFHPSKIHLENQRIKAEITDFKVNNISIQASEKFNNRILYDKNINETERIILKHNENQVSFSFTGLHYSNPEKVQYAYQLEGIDAQPIFTQQIRNVNYPSLAPGEYKFQLKACLDGDWENTTSQRLIIEVKPAPWASWYAFAIYLIIAVAIVGIILKYYYEKNKEKREHAIDQMKLQFFINVSHEFRTPLTLILNPIEQLEQSYDNPMVVKDATQTIKRSAMRLYALTNQILDLRKIDLNESATKIERIELCKFSQDQLAAFKPLAENKNINFIFKCSTSELWFNSDFDKLEKIYANLLSNAIKFNNGNGEIIIELISCSSSQQEVKILFSDQGIGISPEQKNNLFKRFYHPDHHTVGTGIGLNYTKAIVELLGGNINVESKVGEGSTFEVHLYENKHDFVTLNAEKSRSTFVKEIVQSTTYEILSSEQELEINSNAQSADHKLRILIVEDNAELRKHLKQELSQKYKIKMANDGLVGLEFAKSYNPDLIISDVKMPRMNGFELCKTIKSNLETSHIPIILLTARALDNDKLEGYEHGADGYISKPFSFRMLHARIKSILDARAAIKKRYGELNETGLRNLASTSVDENFINKLIEIISKNLEEPDFNINLLTDEIGISRSQLARKIESITGQNTSSFIRSVRLNKASQLLCNEQYTIKEVAYLVGFNSPAYFSKTFKELYGMTPNQYIEKLEEEGEK
ncbi:MAG: two-component regulator propeller domain-containing protein [Mangrovibacterium sp.]